MTTTPPERFELGDRVLRRQQPADAAAIAAAVGDCLEHLRPWLPWASEAAATEAAQRERLTAGNEAWEAGSDFGFVVWDATETRVVGGAGLHRRVGEGGIELGYWLHPSEVGRGTITAASRALVEAAFTLPGVDRVEIRCDEANVRSAAVPERLGFRLDRVEDDEIKTQAETGRSMVWILDGPPNPVL